MKNIPLSRALSAFMVLGCFSLASAQSLRVRDDADVNLNQPNQNTGATANVFVRDIGSGGIRHAFVRFDTTAIPESTSVSRATLRLWVSNIQNPGNVTLHIVEGDWDESTLSDAARPPISAALGTIAITESDKNRWIDVDVTAAAQGWINDPASNFGVALLPSGIRLEMDSKENTGTSHPIELEVVLATGDLTGVTAGVGLTGGGASGDVSLGLDTAFTDARYAAAGHGHDVSEIANAAVAGHGHHVSQITNAATLGPNTFTGNQIIDGQTSIRGIAGGDPRAVLELTEMTSGLGNFSLQSVASGSGNMLQFREGSDTFVTIRSDDDTGDLEQRGNVGIGTTSPTAHLHIFGAQGVDAGAGEIKLENTFGITRSMDCPRACEESPIRDSGCSTTPITFIAWS